jgi:hypothetical protein
MQRIQLRRKRTGGKMKHDSERSLGHRKENTTAPLHLPIRTWTDLPQQEINDFNESNKRGRL